MPSLEHKPSQVAIRTTCCVTAAAVRLLGDKFTSEKRGARISWNKNDVHKQFPAFFPCPTLCADVVTHVGKFFFF